MTDLVRQDPARVKQPSESEVPPASLRRRRRQRWGAGSGVLLIAVVIVVASTMGSGSNPSPTRVIGRVHISGAVELAAHTSRTVVASGPASAADESAVAKAEEQFSLQLLKQLASDSSDSNQLLSPFSLSEALAMTLLGARGTTASQMARALDVEGLPSGEQAEGWNALNADILSAAVKDHLALHNANSIWTQSGFPINTEFLTALQSEFGAGVWQTNFAKNPVAADGAVNAWVKRVTDGLIPTLLNPSDTPPSTAAVLLNAVLFEAQWATQLTNTTTAPFYSPNSTEQTTFLSPQEGESSFEASTGNGIDAVQLPYWNGTSNHLPGRFAALIVMPTKGSLAHLIGSLNASSLDGIVHSLGSQNITVNVPQMKITSNLQLATALAAMGMPNAFEPTADFAGFSSVPTQISEVKQQATLSLTKWGTVAAAATAVVSVASAAEIGPPPIVFNKPFLFLIRDTKTGAILFESEVFNPDAGG